MKVIIKENATKASQTAADILYSKMQSQNKVNLAITAGKTPIETYQILKEKIKGEDISNVLFYNFDEIPFKGEEDKAGVTRVCLNELFFTPTNIPDRQIHALTGANYQEQDATIAKNGGLDLIFMGLGADGHFCGNLPQTTKFTDLTSKIDITVRPDMMEIIENEMLKGGRAKTDALDYYVTMGPKSVMQAKTLVMMVLGKEKAKMVKQAFFGPVDENIPASILQMHPNLILLLDKDAASAL